MIGLFLTPLLFAQWGGYANNAQHTAEAPNASQPLTRIHWSTPVDLNPSPPEDGDLYIHYGSPVITPANTVIVPVKLGASGGFELRAFSGAAGMQLYTLSTDYTLPLSDWIPPYGPVLTVTGNPSPSRPLGPDARPATRRIVVAQRLYYPGPGGTVYYRDQPDSPTGPAGQIAFYGNQLYAANQAAFRQNVIVNTPLTADREGNIYFGFLVGGANPANLANGIARIAADGTGAWARIGTDAATQIAQNCAPALSNDQRTVYVATSGGGLDNAGSLVALDSETLAIKASVALTDPTGGPATISADSSASPTVGPDGDVYFGVVENNCCATHNDRGWLLHFDSTLSQTKIPGSFGWDDTASIVPARLVPSYAGTSTYLILTKYNDYADFGIGNGVNKLAILDPNASMQDEYSAASVRVMKEVLTIAGVTRDPDFPAPAVREWCINTAAVDPFTRSAIVNNEDGTVYRWDFATNSFTERVYLTGGRGEAYTPTVIGPDGVAYAINDAVLFAVGN